MANSATHVITSTGLSGSKSQKVVKNSSKTTSVHVVTPEWLYDSVATGKRMKEYDYRIVVSGVQGQLHCPS